MPIRTLPNKILAALFMLAGLTSTHAFTARRLFRLRRSRISIGNRLGPSWSPT